MRKRWNSVAADYDVIWKVPDYTPIVRRLIRMAGIDLGMMVLDVATGTGIPGLEVAQKVGAHGLVLGIDYSKPMLKEGIRKAIALGLQNIHFILADAHNLPLLNDYFDAVVSCFTFAFLSSPRKAAEEMVRVAKPEGRVACIEWEKPPFNFWAELRRKGGVHDFEKPELVEMLYNSGLGQIHTERIPVLHRRPNVSKKLVKKSQLLTLKIMGLDKKDGRWFFPKIREEYQKLPVDKKHGWLPVLYAGTKPSKQRKMPGGLGDF